MTSRRGRTPAWKQATFRRVGLLGRRLKMVRGLVGEVVLFSSFFLFLLSLSFPVSALRDRRWRVEVQAKKRREERVEQSLGPIDRSGRSSKVDAVGKDDDLERRIMERVEVP